MHVNDFVDKFVFYYAFTAKADKTDQHCEVPECNDEVWAAFSVGTCVTLLCEEHFAGKLSHIHELTCTGRGRRVPTATQNEVCLLAAPFCMHLLHYMARVVLRIYSLL